MRARTGSCGKRAGYTYHHPAGRKYTGRDYRTGVPGDDDRRKDVYDPAAASGEYTDKNIGYSYKAGEWTATSAFSGVQHMQEDGHTVAVLQRDALSHDITITGITLLKEVLYSDRRPGGYRVGIAFYPV